MKRKSIRPKKRPITVLSYIPRFWARYLLVAVLLLLTVVSNALTPLVIQHIVDDVIEGGALEKLMPLLGMLIFVGVFHAATDYYKELNADMLGVRLGGKLRRDLFQHIQTLSVNYFGKTNTGELMARVKDDVDKVWFILGFAGMLIVECVIHTLITLFCMVRISPLLTVVPILIMVTVAIVAVKMEKKLDGCYGAISEENAELTTVAQENLSGVRTVKAFAREQFEIDKFSEHNQKYYELNMDMARTLIKAQPYINFISKMLIVLVVLCGGAMVIFDYNEMTLGKLAAFVEYANGVIWPMECLGWLSNELASAIASGRKLNKIFAETPDISNPEQPKQLAKVEGSVTFDHVSFELDGTQILEDICFELKPGGTVGIMGATGSGKSTIINLVERFYDATEGRVLLDGVDVRELPLATLRDSVSVVMQDVFLFSDSIEENLKLGSHGKLNAERMRRAVSAASAESFIEKLSEQYATIVGERGVGLSGGQKQRISIARAIAKGAPVLILDDATSALDMETEYEIQQSLDALKDVSKLIVAHRISAVKDADEIIILKDGKIAERGTHKQLMERRGLYFATYVAQYDTEQDLVS